MYAGEREFWGFVCLCVRLAFGKMPWYSAPRLAIWSVTGLAVARYPGL
jgi:hypothetical protein